MQHNRDEILVVHFGGLGDVCLSESMFSSLKSHFGDCLVGLGNRRHLDLFGHYFTKTYGIESRHWLYLFSEKLSGPVFRRIVFIGKDRQASLRKRWASYSREKMIFIEMYPAGSFPEPGRALQKGSVHIEDYQLRQLGACGIEKCRAAVPSAGAGPVIIYPETGFSKEKWPPPNFFALADLLAEDGIETIILKPAGLSIPGPFLEINDLSEVKGLFGGGGIFVSNDSGMAHLAGACGLTTVTVFLQFDPLVWHPRGRNFSVSRAEAPSPESLASLISCLFRRGSRGAA